jgi:hypothetical protein
MDLLDARDMFEFEVNTRFAGDELRATHIATASGW